MWGLGEEKVGRERMKPEEDVRFTNVTQQLPRTPGPAVQDAHTSQRLASQGAGTGVRVALPKGL